MSSTVPYCLVHVLPLSQDLISLEFNLRANVGAGTVERKLTRGMVRPLTVIMEWDDQDQTLYTNSLGLVSFCSLGIISTYRDVYHCDDCGEDINTIVGIIIQLGRQMSDRFDKTLIVAVLNSYLGTYHLPYLLQIWCYSCDAYLSYRFVKISFKERLSKSL